MSKRDEFYTCLAAAKDDPDLTAPFCAWVIHEHIRLEKEAIATEDKAFADDIALTLGVCSDCPDTERCRELLMQEVPTDD